MSTVNQKMTAIADAVREKTGQTEPLTLDDLASAISTYTTDANATGAEMLRGAIAYANNQKIEGSMIDQGSIVQTLGMNSDQYYIPQGFHDGKGHISINWQNNEPFIPSKEEQIQYPEDGKAFFEIKCNPIPNEYLVDTEILYYSDIIRNIEDFLKDELFESNQTTSESIIIKNENNLDLQINYIKNINKILEAISIKTNNSLQELVSVIQNSTVFINLVNDNQKITKIDISKDENLYGNDKLIAFTAPIKGFTISIYGEEVV